MSETINWLELLKAELWSFFLFDPKSPFIFTADKFWIFLFFVLLVDAFVYKQKAIRHGFLFVVSIFFYYKTTDLYFILLLFTALWDFLIGKIIHGLKNQTKRKMLLVASILMNLGILSYFKYAYFFTDAFNQLFATNHETFNVIGHWSNSFFGTHFSIDKIILPVGISFFTFQSISYTVEIYRGKLEPLKRFTDFAFFVSFFPQLVAGPIVRSTEFIPQLYQEYRLSRHEFGIAIFWILNGLIKKLVLSDFIAVNFLDRVFAAPEAYSGFENLAAILGYSLQVYADFSGYTDMAIGISLLFGFRLNKNFNSPYKAHDVSDFWRRWHISLSGWLRDYLYIPLGGNKQGTIASYIIISAFILLFTLLSGSWIAVVVAALVVLTIIVISALIASFKKWLDTNINLMITMLVGGFWHGASWNFIIWGGLNGIGLVVSKLWTKVSPWRDKSRWYNRAIGIALTFLFISFTRVWFRTGSNNGWSEMEEKHDISSEFTSALKMLEMIFMKMDWTLAPNVITFYWKVFVVIAIGMIIHWLPENFKESYRNRFSSLPIPVMALAALIAVLFCYQLTTGELQPFIYFQF